MDEERVSNHTRSVLDVAQRHGYISSIESVQSKINLLQAVCMDTYPLANWVHVRDELIKTCNENNKQEAECTHQNVNDDRVAGFARCDDCGAKAW